MKRKALLFLSSLLAVSVISGGIAAAVILISNKTSKPVTNPVDKKIVIKKLAISDEYAYAWKVKSKTEMWHHQHYLMDDHI